MKSIGGEIELDFNSVNVLGNKNKYLLNHQYVQNGRAAIKIALQTIGCKKTFLLPSYLCESIIQPFKELNIPYKFYKINEDLTIDTAHLLECKKKYKSEGVFIINYFGMLSNQKNSKFIEELKKDIWIIEDFTHGSLIESENRMRKSFGHIIISSMRKYLPVPDGCIIINNTDLKLPEIESRNNSFSRQRTIAKLLRWEFLNNETLRTKEIESLFLSLFLQVEKSVDETNPVQKMSYLSELILSSLNLAEIKKIRKKNFKALLNYFSSSTQLQKHFQPIYKSEGNGSPFYFPVRVKGLDRKKLLSGLVNRNLFCSIMWPMPEEIKISDFPASHKLSSEIVCIPIDQRYTDRDMKDIATRFKLLL
jgi:dTDP-4-amino-4,6-dideoxygalactose transaminase